MTGIRTTALGAAVLGVGLLLGACASPAAKTAAPVAPSAPTLSATPAPVAAPATQVTASAPAAPAVQAVPVAQVAPVVQVAPISTPPAPPVASPAASASPVPSIPTSVSAPHFTTPDDAMRYLAAAYNSGDEAAIRHVTTPDSRSQFESERQWVKTFRFRDCTANGAPTWDYNCTLDIIANVPGVSPNIDATTGLVVMDEVALLVAPAARTGYYVEANEGCGG
jgi:predicted lipid-binding transport protein (Tim44 family)